MPSVNDLMSQHISNAQSNAQTWGSIIYNVRAFGAKGDGTTDDTTAINSAVDEAATLGGEVYFPPGTYLVDPSVSILLKNGVKYSGAGIGASVILLKPVAGSAFKRTFNPSGPNAYVQDILIEGLSVVMTHPATAAPSNYEQIGFDFRHITRSVIRGCYVGNYPRGTVSKTIASQIDAIQGYGVVMGNVSSSDPAYCGGEVNMVEACTVWGAKKAIVTDDSTLSPVSASHGTSIIDCDVQICETGIGVESRYTAGVKIEGNTVQSVRKARGSSNTTYCYRLEGYGSRIVNKYLESGNASDYLLYLGANSEENKVTMNYTSATNGASITDLGTNNVVEYHDLTTGKYTRMINKFKRVEAVEAFAKFDGATGTVSASSNVATVVRNSTGDYTITWATPFSSANYTVTANGLVDASANGGVVSIRSQTATTLRLVTYRLTGTAGQLDFTSVHVSARE